MGNKIKAIFFDSGKVLNVPKSGHWFISQQFFDYIDKQTFYNISRRKRELAFARAYEYIGLQTLITDQEQEKNHFREFYRIFSNNLPELQLNDIAINNLASDLVYNYDKYCFFDDALNVIPKLAKKYKLGVISDAWPSLIGVFKKADMYKYFSVFVVSSLLGTCKPNKRMYETALNELNISASEAVFIDDSVANCEGAVKVGISSILLCRNKPCYVLHKALNIGKRYNVINNLYQLRLLK